MQPTKALHGLTQCEVGHRPDIRPPQGHQQVDVGGPRSDARHDHQRVAGCVIVHLADATKVDTVPLDRGIPRAVGHCCVPEAIRGSCRNRIPAVVQGWSYLHGSCRHDGASSSAI